MEISVQSMSNCGALLSCPCRLVADTYHSLPCGERGIKTIQSNLLQDQNMLLNIYQKPFPLCLSSLSNAHFFSFLSLQVEIFFNLVNPSQVIIKNNYVHTYTYLTMEYKFRFNKVSKLDKQIWLSFYNYNLLLLLSWVNLNSLYIYI